MSNVITAKLNVTAIDKAKLFRGEKGVYLDIVLIPSPASQYGDYMVVQSVTKEEREAGKRGAILGNAKVMGAKPAQPTAKPAPVAAAAAKEADEDVPF